MRAAGPLADPPQVLLDRIAMAREPGPRRAWPGGEALVDLCRPWNRTLVGTGDPSARPARPDHDLVGIRDGRVQQLDLETDHRVEPGRLGRVDETDRAVQPGVIGDGQPGEPQLDRSIDELVGRGRAVEEREVGVAVELGVTELSHESPGPTGRLGPHSIEQTF